MMFELFIMALFLYSLDESLDVIKVVEALLLCFCWAAGSV